MIDRRHGSSMRGVIGRCAFGRHRHVRRMIRRRGRACSRHRAVRGVIGWRGLLGRGL
jgi:hypothetical protein